MLAGPPVYLTPKLRPNRKGHLPSTHREPTSIEPGTVKVDHLHLPPRSTRPPFIAQVAGWRRLPGPRLRSVAQTEGLYTECPAFGTRFRYGGMVFTNIHVGSWHVDPKSEVDKSKPTSPNQSGHVASCDQKTTNRPQNYHGHC